MTIRFACPKCKTAYTVNEHNAGKKSDCKVCGQRLQVPAPPRSKTILGEVLPSTGPAVAPARREPAPRPSFSPPPPTAHAPSTGPIRFNCPHCQTSYVINRNRAGGKMDCKNCLETIAIPGVSVPVAAPRPTPAAVPVVRQVQVAPQPVPEPEPQEDDSSILNLSPSYSQPKPKTGGTANRVLASLGAALMLIGLFLPMIHGPMGFWMSFIDVPWKAITVGFAISDEVAKNDGDMPGLGGPKPGGPNKQANPKSALLMVVGIGAIVYPLAILALVAFSAIKIATGGKPFGFLLAGIASGGATVLYAGGLLLLNTIEELRIVIVMLSPGFGWAVMLIGAFLLLLAGMIRRGR